MIVIGQWEPAGDDADWSFIYKPIDTHSFKRRMRDGSIYFKSNPSGNDQFKLVLIMETT